MVISLLVNLTNEPGIIGVAEPRSHQFYRELPWKVTRVGEADKPVHRVSGFINLPLTASDLTDCEENAVRYAEQMVREAFRRLRSKTA